MGEQNAPGADGVRQMPSDPNHGEVDRVWPYRGRELRLIRGTLGYEGHIWEKGIQKARIRYGPFASRETAIEATELAAFDLGPVSAEGGG